MSDRPTFPPDVETESSSVEATSTPDPEAKLPPPPPPPPPKEPKPRIGTLVRRRREEANMSLETLAERAELTPNYVGGIENGVRDPSLSTLIALAQGLNVNPRDLLPPIELTPEAKAAARLLYPPAKRRMRRLRRLLAKVKELHRFLVWRLRVWKRRRRTSK